MNRIKKHFGIRCLCIVKPKSEYAENRFKRGVSASIKKNMTEGKTLFEKIGGINAVNAAVDIFYQKVLADESIKHFFANTDMKAQAGKQKSFLAYVFGAPMAYTGKNMRDAHAHMNLTENHFNAVAMHLADTLKQLNVEQELIDEVVKIAVSAKDDVLGN